MCSSCPVLQPTLVLCPVRGVSGTFGGKTFGAKYVPWSSLAQLGAALGLPVEWCGRVDTC